MTYDEETYLLDSIERIEKKVNENNKMLRFLNTLVHEAKYVQSHICNYYNIFEEGEQAAYLIGYIVQRMHRVFKNFIKKSMF